MIGHLSEVGGRDSAGECTGPGEEGPSPGEQDLMGLSMVGNGWRWVCPCPSVDPTIILLLSGWLGSSG